MRAERCAIFLLTSERFLFIFRYVCKYKLKEEIE